MRFFVKLNVSLNVDKVLTKLKMNGWNFNFNNNELN